MTETQKHSLSFGNSKYIILNLKVNPWVVPCGGEFCRILKSGVQSY